MCVFLLAPVETGEHAMTLPCISPKAVPQHESPRASVGPELPNRKLNVKEAAAYLGLSVNTLNKMRLCTGPRYLKLGRRVLYDVRDLEAWAEERKRNHTSE